MLAVKIVWIAGECCFLDFARWNTGKVDWGEGEGIEEEKLAEKKHEETS